MVTEEQLQEALKVAAVAAQAAANAQAEAQRAVEDVRGFVNKIRAWEAKNKGVTIVEGSPAVDLSPLEERIARLEASGSGAERIAALETKVSALSSRNLIPVSNVSEDRVKRLEDTIAAVVQELKTRPVPIQQTVVDPVSADVLDRMAALEDLVVESVQAPKALADQLRITAEVMDAMDHRITAMREADKAMLELHRQASEQAALAQGGLAVVVESIKTDVATLASAVAELRNQIARRDDYTARIVKRGGGR